MSTLTKTIEKFNRSRNGVITNTLNSVDIVEMVKCLGVVLDVFDGVFCHIKHYNQCTEFANDLYSERDRFKKQGKGLLQTLAKKIAKSVYGGNLRWDVNEQFECVTDNWTEGNYDDGVKEWWPLRNGYIFNKSEIESDVDDHDIVKSINQLPCHLKSYIIGPPNRQMNIVIRELDAFYSNILYYGDTDSSYIHKERLSYAGWEELT